MTQASLGAWLLKADPTRAPMAQWRRTGFASVTSRCVRATYRAELVREGQPVLLWISGQDVEHPAGIHAAGRTTGPVVEDDDGPAMQLALSAVDPVVLRSDLLAEPDLSRLEVIRMPAGSNPSFVTVEEFAIIRHLGAW